MPHGLRVYDALCNSNFDAARALSVATIVATARTDATDYNHDSTVDVLFEAGFSEDQSEAIAGALRCCFPSERFRGNFSASKLKFAMVRAGLSAPCADGLLVAIDPCVVTGRDAEVRASIPHVPAPGRVVMCDFSFLARPEMKKQRRAIVVSKRFASITGRCVIVPISMHASNANHPLHHEFPPGKYPFFHDKNPVWAVCDHVYTVGLGRLWQVNVNHKPQLPRISDDDLDAIRAILGTSFSG